MPVDLKIARPFTYSASDGAALSRREPQTWF
jgi:hypothetical protein